MASISRVRRSGVGLLALSATALLASPQGALAACLGEFTGTVLCDAANPATAGTLSTSFSGPTTVNINAGAGITTGGASVNIPTEVGDLIFNNNDPAGSGEIVLLNDGIGAVRYTGSSNVTSAGPNSFDAINASGTGAISITQTGGVVESIAARARYTEGGDITIDTTGSQVTDTVFVDAAGVDSSIFITTGAVGSISARLGFTGHPAIKDKGRNISVNVNGPVTGAGVFLLNKGFGTTDVTINAAMAGAAVLQVRNDNAGNTSAMTVTANHDVAEARIQNNGSGLTTVNLKDISANGLSIMAGGDVNATVGSVRGVLLVTGRQVNTVVNGDVTANTFIPSGSAVFDANMQAGSVTVNGAISGTFASSGFNLRKGANLQVSSTQNNAVGNFNLNGAITVSATSVPGMASGVTGVSSTAAFLSGGAANFNFGAVTATATSADNAALAYGIDHLHGLGDSTTRVALTANGPVTATANSLGLPGYAYGIRLTTSPSPGSLAGDIRVVAHDAVTATVNGAGGTSFGIVALDQNGTAYTGKIAILANGAVTATSDGTATAFAITRDNSNPDPTQKGTLGDVSVTARGTVTATSTSAAAFGVKAEMLNTPGTPATLAIRTEGNVVATGVAGTYGIIAAHNGDGALSLEALGGVHSSGVGISVSRATAGDIAVTTGAGAEIIGTTGIVTTGGTTSLTLAGQVTGTGGTAIQFGGSNDILKLMAGAGLGITGNVLGNGTSVLQLGGTGAASFDVSRIGATAQYRDFASLDKTGSSIWTLTGTNAAAQPWTVHGGTLAVNGTIGGITVNASGTPGGGGTVGNTVINGGTLAPGNSIGTLNISGSFTMTAASTYLVQVSGNISDRTIVAGAANIAGTVVIDTMTRLTQKTTYTIMSSSGVNGTFSSANLLVANNFARNPMLSYVGNDVLLTLDPGVLSPILPGNTGANQFKVAGAIDNALLAGNNLSNAFSAIFNYSGNNLLNGLTQLFGETATGSQQTTFNAMTQFMGMMTDPFTAGRSDGANAPAYADEDVAVNAYAATGKARSQSEREAYAAIHHKAPLARNYDPRWSVWGAGFGGSQTTDGSTAAGSSTNTSRLFGVAAGADYMFAPNTVAGFALAGGGSSFSVTGGGSGRSDLFQAGAFVRHSNGPAYISAALAYGWQDVTTERTVTIAGVDRLRAQFNANAFSGRAEGGYRFVSPWISGIGITPYAAGQFTTFDLPAYAEQVVSGANTFALAYGSRIVTATRSELGLRADKSFAMTDAILTLRGRAAWTHDFNPDRTVGATFQTLPGASFIVNGARQASESALTSASAEVKWLNGWSIAGTFEGEFSEVTRSYAGKGVARYTW